MISIKGMEKMLVFHEVKRGEIFSALKRDCAGDHPIRFAVTCQGASSWQYEIDALCGDALRESIFTFRQRYQEDESSFNVALVIPTGIGAEIGGHAGDAGPVAKLLAKCCDTLITHPNVVNASDINELPDNALYVEGSVLSRFLMGTIGLRPVKRNRVLALIEKHPDRRYVIATINSVNAARASYGLDCAGITEIPPLLAKSAFSSSGRVVGEVSGLEILCRAVEDSVDFDAIAISSLISIPKDVHDAYYAGDQGVLNPWGSAEADITHFLSVMYGKPSAHAPMLESRETENMDMSVVDARMAAEVISMTFFQSVLKGLQRSPALVSTGDGNFYFPNVLKAENVSCLVIPDSCIGLPTLAALEQDIPVIAVKENKNVMKNDLNCLPWNSGQLHFAATYLETAGILMAMRCGIVPNSVCRPI